jgi:hypothetical protein
VNPRWTAAGRRHARKPGKSDALDAHAVALLVWREAGTLPRVAPEDDTAVLDVLVTEREGAQAEATRLRNQLHQLLLQLDPEYRTHLPPLTTGAGLVAVEGDQTASARLVDQARAAAVRRTVQRLRLALSQAEDLAKQIAAHAQVRFSALTDLRGVGLLTAGALAGILVLADASPPRRNWLPMLAWPHWRPPQRPWSATALTGLGTDGSTPSCTGLR